MAERRMFSKTVIESDAFLNMPMSARLLYYDIAMRADDDGFVNNPQTIMRLVGASPDDLTLLTLREFLIPFESGVVAVRHWHIHNYIRKDAYKPTSCRKEKLRILLDEDKTYVLAAEGETLLLSVSTQDRTGQERSGQDSTGQDRTDRFQAPTLEAVEQYCLERENGVDAEHFVEYYRANGWQVGKEPMRDWQAVVRSWESGRTGRAKPRRRRSFCELAQEIGGGSG